MDIQLDNIQVLMQSDDRIDSTICSDITMPLPKQCAEDFSSVNDLLSEALLRRTQHQSIQKRGSLTKRPVVMKTSEHRKARSLGCWVYSGPGQHHDVLGRLDKEGLVTTCFKSQDNHWTQVKVSQLEGWVQTSKVRNSSITQDSLTRSPTAHCTRTMTRDTQRW